MMPEKYVRDLKTEDANTLAERLKDKPELKAFKEQLISTSSEILPKLNQ
jgi:hypothetical protein